mgnify:CR=1 FL=1
MSSMIEIVNLLDTRGTSFLSLLFPHNRFFDHLFAFFSLDGISFYLWIFVTLCFLVWKIKDYKKIIFYFLISFSLTWILVNSIIKNVVRRDRPWIAQNLDITICPNDFSFPSGHASSAFAGASIFASFDKKRRIFYYVIAIIISYSRIYLSCHYLMDVTIGALIGYLISRATVIYIPYRVKPFKL